MILVEGVNLAEFMTQCKELMKQNKKIDITEGISPKSKSKAKGFEYDSLSDEEVHSDAEDGVNDSSSSEDSENEIFESKKNLAGKKAKEESDLIKSVIVVHDGDDILKPQIEISKGLPELEV